MYHFGDAGDLAPRLRPGCGRLGPGVAWRGQIWVDDDVRLMGHMPLGLTCFCDHCLAVFEKESGTNYRRASLRAALTAGSPEACAALRKAWLAHNRATIARLLTLIEQTVHATKPEMPLGFMTGDRFFEGYDFDRWAEALAGPNRAPVYWRPGGGFYEDSTPGGMVGKSHDIGRQISLLPLSVAAIESEIENFPYQRLKKAAHITAVEAASHIRSCSPRAWRPCRRTKSVRRLLAVSTPTWRHSTSSTRLVFRI